jgi:hypothetical protein
MTLKPSSFSQPLRHSKLVSCSRDQIVRTTDSCKHRHNFGLKAPVKSRTNLINVRSLDSEHGFADISPGYRRYLVLKRMQSLNTPMHGTERLFTLQSTNVDRKKFFHWLDEQRIDQLDNNDVVKHKLVSAYISGLIARQVPNAGSIYSLPGCVQNTPNGLLLNSKIRGRVVDDSGRLVAAGGVIARTTSAVFSKNKSPFQRQEAQDFTVERLTMFDGKFDLILSSQSQDMRRKKPADEYGKTNHQIMDSLYRMISNRLFD